MQNPDLSVNAKALYALLATYADREGECFPSNTTLATCLGVTDRSIRTWVGELVAGGVVFREAQYADGRQINSRTFLIDVVASTREEGLFPLGEEAGVTPGGERGFLQNNTSKNKTSKNTSPRRATGIPKDFKPDADLREWTRVNCPHIDAHFEWLQFCDHALATGRLQKDWNGCWRTWARRAEKQEAEKQARAQRGKVIY
jgi:hypothetical protein